MKRFRCCLAILFCLGAVSPFLEAKEGEKIQDIFEPSIKLREPSNLKSESTEVSARLDGIGLGSEKAFAVINSKIYQLGEEKEGIQVTHIRKKEVDILIDGSPETLQLIHHEGWGGLQTAKEEKPEAQ